MKVFTQLRRDDGEPCEKAMIANDGEPPFRRSMIDLLLM
jgi:hypothetical protein